MFYIFLVDFCSKFLFVIFYLIHNDAIKNKKKCYKGTVYVRYVAQYFSKINWLTNSDWCQAEITITILITLLKMTATVGTIEVVTATVC